MYGVFGQMKESGSPKKLENTGERAEIERLGEAGYEPLGSSAPSPHLYMGRWDLNEHTKDFDY